HNWAELIPFILYAILGIPLPLLVPQVLVIDLAIDVIPSLALSREPPEAGIMEEPPRSTKERLFTRRVLLRSVFIGVIIAVGAMIGCIAAWTQGGWHLGMQLAASDPVYVKGVTFTFAGIVVAQAGNVLACRTSKQSTFKASLRTNKWIIFGIMAQIGILSLLVYLPIMQHIFTTTALTLMDWAFLVSLAVIVVFAEEVRKFFSRKFSKTSAEALKIHDHT
ncbi:MAG: cation transporting ATPase C-terminal domain-containing protein, partial [Candidatus Bathyarchaeia archaeon]